MALEETWQVPGAWVCLRVHASCDLSFGTPSASGALECCEDLGHVRQYTSGQAAWKRQGPFEERIGEAVEIRRRKVRK